MDNNDFLKSLSKSLIEATKSVLEGKAHTVPKTEKEKKLAALAEPKDKITHADVLKGRGVVKEEEQIDELSTPTLRKYREKARDDAFDADAVDDERRLRKRSFGHNQAGKKIIKRGDTLRAEEVQIDELSKSTLASYIKKASTSAATSGMEHGVKKAERDEVDRMTNRHMSFDDKEKIHKTMKTTHRDVEKPREKAGKRIWGINKAVDKITKEEVEVQQLQIDEAMDAADRFKHHHDHAKSLLKSISDHLKAEHEAASKHVDYKGKKGPNWGHVGSMEHVANQLSHIHDMLARKGEYAESVEVKDEVTLTEAELQALEQIAETIEVTDETEELDEARGRPKLPRDAQGNIIRGGSTAKASVAKADEEPAALGYQLRKAASINKPVHFMNGEKKEVSNQHINAFNDHMAARKTAAEKAAFQSKAHKSHAEFVKAVSAPVPHAKKDTGEIVKYR